MIKGTSRNPLRQWSQNDAQLGTVYLNRDLDSPSKYNLWVQSLNMLEAWIEEDSFIGWYEEVVFPSRPIKCPEPTIRQHIKISRVNKSGDFETMFLKDITITFIKSSNPPIFCFEAGSYIDWQKEYLGWADFNYVGEESPKTIINSQGYKIHKDGTLVNPTPGFEFL